MRTSGLPEIENGAVNSLPKLPGSAFGGLIKPEAEECAAAVSAVHYESDLRIDGLRPGIHVTTAVMLPSPDIKLSWRMGSVCLRRTSRRRGTRRPHLHIPMPSAIPAAVFELHSLQPFETFLQADIRHDRPKSLALRDVARHVSPRHDNIEGNTIRCLRKCSMLQGLERRPAKRARRRCQSRASVSRQERIWNFRCPSAKGAIAVHFTGEEPSLKASTASATARLHPAV